MTFSIKSDEKYTTLNYFTQYCLLNVFNLLWCIVNENKISTVQSKRFNIYSTSMTEDSWNAFDDKRYILHNGIICFIFTTCV